jgi:hypothetical protein
MPLPRKRPCRICLRWFYPDPRVGDRQRGCGNPECQSARRRKTQANWRAKNPSYAAAYRIDQRHLEPSSDPEPLRVPAPLEKLPWDIAKDQFGGKGVDFIMVMGILLLRAAKDQSSGYPIDTKGVPGNNPALPRKTSPGGAHTETQATPHHAANSGVSSIGPPPGAPPGPPPGPVPATAGVAG